VLLARSSVGMTRAVAARRAGVARSTWERIEGGDPAVTVAALVAATEAVGLDLVLQTYPGREPGLRDSGQLALAQQLIAMAGPPWRATLEEPAGEHAQAVDVVLWGPEEIVTVEIERMLVDWQAQFRRWSAKRDWLAAQHSRPVRLVVVAADTRRNRVALAPFATAIRQTLPAGSRAVLDAVRTGSVLNADGLCWMRQPRR
jgi:transcriptional regulator with XRE-family HTH domain